jgi:hypothetical protein
LSTWSASYLLFDDSEIGDPVLTNAVIRPIDELQDTRHCKRARRRLCARRERRTRARRRHAIVARYADAEPRIEPQALTIRSDGWIPAQELRVRKRPVLLDERVARVVLDDEVILVARGNHALTHRARARVPSRRGRGRV